MDSVCALFYVFYWVFPRAKSKHTKSKRRGRKDSFLSFDDANKFVQLLTTLSTTIHGNHSGEILALRGGSLGPCVTFHYPQIQYDVCAHDLTQLDEHNHLQQKDTLVKQPQDLLDIYSHNILDSPQMSAVQQWPHGIRYVLGDLFPWYPPKKLKYGKPRFNLIGESTLT